MSEAAGLYAFDTRLRNHVGEPGEWPQLALFGQPVGHSLSPILHHAALRERGRSDRYGLVEVAPEHLAGALDAAHAAGVRGINLTLPHKASVLDGVARRSAEVDEIGAANTLVRQGEQWVAHNTDSRGLAMALERMLQRGLQPALRSVLVIGSGGAARAAVHSSRALGARRLRLAARNLDHARWAEAQGADILSLEDLSVEGVSLIVQCTPLGLRPADPSPVLLRDADESLAVFDMVYGGERSSLLRAADARGLVASDGRAMLVAQAALAFSMWYGGLPPLEAMAESAGLSWPLAGGKR
jgi:shikimate dehydrogenase